MEEDHSKREQLAEHWRGVSPSSLPFSLSLLEARLKLWATRRSASPTLPWPLARLRRQREREFVGWEATKILRTSFSLEARVIGDGKRKKNRRIETKKRKTGHFDQVTPSVAAIQLNPQLVLLSLFYIPLAHREPFSRALLQNKEFDETALRGLLIMQLQPGLG